MYRFVSDPGETACGAFAACSPRPRWSCYGGEIPTSHIDTLAAGGLRFASFYNTARCSTTRAALLTGLYPHQAGMGHLGQQHGTLPWKRGFERTATTRYGELAFPREQSQPPTKFVYLDGREVPADSPEVGAGGWYGTEMFTDWALRFIDDACDRDMPFFVYVSHGAAHFPLKAPADVIARHGGRDTAGWDRLREERHHRQIALGLVDPTWPLAPRPGFANGACSTTR
jgi:arylsulfatase